MATDPIIKDHQLWIGFVQPQGLVVSPHALKNAQAVLSRNVSLQQEILRRHTAPDFDGNLRLKNFPAFTQEFWGWRESDLAAPPDDLSARLPEYGETLRPTWVVRGGPKKGSDAQTENLILVEELPWTTDFDKAIQQSEERRWHASPQSRFERLLRETGVSIGLLVSPERIRLVYAPKGESSGHATFPVHQMTMAANWPMLAALHLLLHSDRLFIGPENQRLPAILDASRRYQNEVSIRLAGQVLRALNELVRGFQEADRAAHGAILAEALQHDPSHIYGGMLTTLMRMVFVLYAEDRSLMGSDETWLQNYSISGLYERLRADAGQYPDTMDSRYGAWAQIITLTRLLYDGGGHGSWRLPPRHGGLFDPDAFPFLEGRPWESKRAATALIEPPLVSDGILFRILQDLLYLEGERISYRALDVEQIGSVYEAMMGFTVETANGISIGLGSDHLVVNLEDFLAKKPADRAKWLKENAGCEVTGKAIDQLKFAASVDELLAALRRRISKLYLDQNSNPVTVPAGGIYLQPTEERRRSGSHYTPRSLTQPIVKTTLDPVLAQLGDNPTPDQILGLKVCDPAMGSGAFLVEACRYLGEKLEKAWIAHDLTPGIPIDQDPLLHARRVVAQRCLYGVDKNPFAVNLAKLSLWLATFAKDHPFTFVDHTLRCGDSLVGLTAQQIEAFHWQPKEEGALLRDLPSRLHHILNSRAQILDAADDTPYETLAQKLAKSEEAMIDLRLAGDLTVAAFFSAEKPKDREARRKELAENFHRAHERITDLELDDELKRTVGVLKAGPNGVKPFHWELEFPEVFRLDIQGRRTGGFDAMVGNPPFLAGANIWPTLGASYRDFLRQIHEGSEGKAVDIVAHFIRRTFELSRLGGTVGLIATKTVAQGDTRIAGLHYVCTNGGQVYSALKRMMWPGEAAVVVSLVHFSKGLSCRYTLDEQTVPGINSLLLGTAVEADPRVLHQNKNKSFRGHVLYGMGFIFDDTDTSGATSSLDRMNELLATDSRNGERIFPYIGGAELNTSPKQAHHRFVINFAELTQEQAEQWPSLVSILRDKVWPERAKLGGYSVAVKRSERWWQFGTYAAALQQALIGLPRCLALSQVSKHHAVAFQPTSLIFAHTVVVFPLPTYAAFSAIQCQAHEAWARFLGSSLEDRLRYTASDCFDTYPFPSDFETQAELERIGREYYEYRATLMIRNGEGLTKTYNRFHDCEQRSPDILRLRQLHAEMDRAVLETYGWHDLAEEATSEFLLDYEDAKDDEEGSSEQSEQSEQAGRMKPFRYRWPDDFRDRVLARLLDLNQIRAAERTQTTVAASTAKRVGRRRGSLKNSAPVASPDLFEIQGPIK